MKSYDLIILTKESFPDGLAATNRIKCYASSIAECKKVLLLTVAGPKYNVVKEIDQSGTCCGIDYRYLGKASLNYNPSKFVKAWFMVKRYVKLLFLLLFSYNYSSLLIVGREIFLNTVPCLIVWVKRKHIFKEISETPEYIENKMHRRIQTKVCDMYDGLIIISNGIREYFSYNKDDSHFFNLPILVDMNQYRDYEHVEKKNNFFYCSGGNLERDGFIDTITGFLKFAENNDGYKLQVATPLNLSDPYHRKAKEIMDANSQKIEYLGTLSAAIVPQKLMCSLGLLVTPHSDYKTRGFPTKLGEYLASGTPVICSSIESLRSQIDSDCVYFVHPNSPQEIADKLLYIVNNPKEAKITALKGRQIVIERYTMVNYKKNLVSFLSL